MVDFHVIDVQEQPTVGVRQVVPMAEIRSVFDRGFSQVMSAVQESGGTPAGAPYARYRGIPGETVDVEVGFPVTGPVTGGADLVSGALPGGRAAEAVHVGDYETLADTYEKLFEWLAEQDLRPGGDFWEVYEAGPDSDADPSTWRTRVLVLLSAPQLPG